MKHLWRSENFVSPPNDRHERRVRFSGTMLYTRWRHSAVGNTMIQRLSASELAERFENGTDKDIRSLVFELPSNLVRSEQPLFRHQAETLLSIERNQGASGTIHLRTGAGRRASRSKSLVAVCALTRGSESCGRAIPAC